MRDWDFDFNLDEEDPMGPIISPENAGEKERGGIHPGSIGEEYCQCHRIQQIQFKVRERETERIKRGVGGPFPPSGRLRGCPTPAAAPPAAAAAAAAAATAVAASRERETFVYFPT